MNFERLNNSIALNIEEKPSIYMALCMVESMFRDIEDASGTDISQTDAGDDQLPTKLIWLSRKILKIYSEKASEFERNRGRLDDMMQKLRSMESELALIGDPEGAYARMKEKESELRSVLQKAQERKDESERIRRLCEAMEAEIAAMQNDDTKEMEQELKKLSAEKDALTVKHAETVAALNNTRDSVQELKAQAVKDAASLQTETETLDRIQSEKRARDQKREEVEKAIESLRTELASKAGEHDRVIEDKAYYELKLSELEQEIAVCLEETIPPLKKEIEEQNSRCEAAKAELDGLKREREAVIFRYAQLNRQIEDAAAAAAAKRSELQKKQDELEQASKELESIESSISEKAEKLSSLQSETDLLTHEKLPQLRSLINENEKENEELNSIVSGLMQRNDELIRQNDKLKSDEDALSKNVDMLTQTRAELTASYDAKNEALSALRKNVEALRGKNDREKEQQYRRQLEEERDKLTDLSRICTELEQQLTELQAEREERQAKADALRAQKDSLDEANSRIGILIRELAPCGSSELTQQVRALQQRQAFLEEIRKGLEKATSLLGSTFQTPPEVCSRPDRIGELLQTCDKGLSSLQNELLKCANEIKDFAKSEERV